MADSVMLRSDACSPDQVRNDCGSSYNQLTPMDYSMKFDALTFDPDSPLSWEQQMDKQLRVMLKRKIAHEKVQRGRDQVSHGIKGDKKFKAETIRMLMEMYLLGLYQAYLKPDLVGEALKLHETKKGKTQS